MSLTIPERNMILPVEVEIEVTGIVFVEVTVEVDVLRTWSMLSKALRVE